MYDFIGVAYGFYADRLFIKIQGTKIKLKKNPKN